MSCHQYCETKTLVDLCELTASHWFTFTCNSTCTSGCKPSDVIENISVVALLQTSSHKLFQETSKNKNLKLNFLMAPSLGIVGKLQNSIFIKVYVKERDVLFEPEKYDIYKKGGKWLKENVRDIIYQSEE